MKIKNNLLTFFHNGVDKSKEINPFGSEYSMTLTTTGHLDIGYHKHLRQVFFEIKTANTALSVITIQKWTGSAWADIKILDETNGFKKSGFIYLDEDDVTTKQLHNGVDQYWYRLKVSVNTSAIILNGVNLVFCNLEDLKMLEPAIEKFYPREISSHIFSMVAAREYILRRINNAQPMNYYNVPLNALTGQQFIDIRLLNQFDIFDINEIRDAAVLYTLYLIMFNRQDEADDVYAQKAKEYLLRFEDSFKLFTGRKLSIDLLNDGQEDSTDKINSIRTVRLIR